MIASMGPPCNPDEIWNACEPAMTVIPNFLITGILAVVVGILVLIWVFAFLGKKHGGVGMILLSILMLLFGGGIFPPLIGIIGGVAGIKINTPFTEQQRNNRSGSLSRLLAKLWPWPLVALAVWLVGQWIVGYLFADFMMDFAYVSVLLILALLPLSVFSGSAYDIQKQAG